MTALADIWWRFVRFGFRLLYNELAFTYDLVSYVVSLGQWRQWQQSIFEFLPLPQTGRILELAHGTGNLQIDLQERSYQTVALDFSPAMGRIAQRKLLVGGYSGELVRGQAQHLPFGDSTFSAIISTFPTNFIVDPHTLTEIQRVLKPDGVCVVVTNGVLTGRGLLASLLEFLYRITGQRADDLAEAEQQMLQLFQSPLLDAKIQHVDLPRSQVTLVILRRR